MEEHEIEKAILVFSKYMKPAESRFESDTQLTTPEILAIFQELLGEVVFDNDDMYNILICHDYIYDFVDGKFRWLIKKEE